MREREYHHLENMCNLHEIPAPYHSFTVSVLPVKWRGASAAPVRAVAIIEASNEREQVRHRHQRSHHEEPTLQNGPQHPRPRHRARDCAIRPANRHLGAIARRRFRRRCIRWIRSGRNRCQTTGSWARSSASASTPAITSGSPIAGTSPRKKRACSPAPTACSSREALLRFSRATSAAFRRSAATSRRRCSSSTLPATSCRHGAAPAPVTSGRRRCTASPLTAKTTSGSPRTRVIRC